jgi:molybdopterin-guanine dinucleotide biosynthesis protein A
MPHNLAADRIAGVILAGGKSRRMGGGDKCCIELGGRPILSRIIERVRPQVGKLVLNANGDPARFAAFGLDVVADAVPDFAGPLAGVLTGMLWARAHAPDCAWIVTIAGDAPFVPPDLVELMMDAVRGTVADMAVAASGGRDHPVFGLWPVRLAGELRAALVEEGVRKVDLWTDRYRLVRADWPDVPVDPFFNLNTPEDFARAEALIARGQAA